MSARFQRPPHVAMVESSAAEAQAPVLYLAPLPDGPVSELDGPAAIIWQEAVAGPDADDIARRVAARARVALTDIESDVRAFLEELVERGLLLRIEPPP